MKYKPGLLSVRSGTWYHLVSKTGNLFVLGLQCADEVGLVAHCLHTQGQGGHGMAGMNTRWQRRIHQGSLDTNRLPGVCVCVCAERRKIYPQHHHMFHIPVCLLIAKPCLVSDPGRCLEGGYPITTGRAYHELLLELMALGMMHRVGYKLLASLCP